MDSRAVRCGDQFFHAPVITTFSVSGVANGVKTFTIFIAQAEVVKQHGGNAGISHFYICFQSNTAFKNINGKTGTIGILPLCGSVAVAPCESSRTKDSVGDVIETAIVLANDPKGC